MVCAIKNLLALRYRAKVVLHAGSNNSISKICAKLSVFTDPVTYTRGCVYIPIVKFVYCLHQTQEQPPVLDTSQLALLDDHETISKTEVMQTVQCVGGCTW